MDKLLGALEIEVDHKLAFLNAPAQAEEILRQFIKRLQQRLRVHLAFAQNMLGRGARFKHFGHNRLGLLQHLGAAVELFHHALERDQGFKQHHQIARQREAVLAHDLGDVVNHLADAQIAHGCVLIIEQHFEHIGAEQVFIGQFALRPIAQHILHGELVAVGERVDQIDDFAAAGAAQMADQAEIDQRDAALFVDKDIARMRVGMKKALLQNHGKQGVGDAVGQHAAGVGSQAFRRHVFQ